MDLRRSHNHGRYLLGVLVEIGVALSLIGLGWAVAELGLLIWGR